MNSSTFCSKVIQILIIFLIIFLNHRNMYSPIYFKLFNCTPSKRSLLLLGCQPAAKKQLIAVL